MRREDKVHLHADLAPSLGSYELTAEEFRKIAIDIVGQRRQRGHDTQELSDEAIEELKALGYVD